MDCVEISIYVFLQGGDVGRIEGRAKCVLQRPAGAAAFAGNVIQSYFRHGEFSNLVVQKVSSRYTGLLYSLVVTCFCNVVGCKRGYCPAFCYRICHHGFPIRGRDRRGRQNMHRRSPRQHLLEIGPAELLPR